jgi:hypothetical protein
MLRFTNKPDEIFILLINEAIEDMICYVEMDDDLADREDALSAYMPRTSELFDAKGAMDQLRALRECLNSDKLYMPTDYHWLLLYECLRSYCAYFNDERVGDLYEVHKIESIDFSWLIGHYFWDTDFLNDDIPNVPMEVRKMMGISSETFGLTAGLKPHPDELVLAECRAELVKAFEGQPVNIFIPGSKVYPPLSDPQDN